MSDFKKNQLIVKSNFLIEASYKLSLQEARIILLLTSMIKKNDKDFFNYRIHIKDFNDFIGIKSTGNYTRTKQITKKLREKTLLIKDNIKKTELQIGWLSSIEYFKGQGFVELEFSPKLKPYLLDLKKFFTKYQIQNIAKLDSLYSIRVYELLKQYEKIGNRTFKIKNLKETLGIIDKYRKYNDFKKKVIITAQKELKKKADIYFKFNEIKTGRKITSIEFLIYRKKEKIKLHDQKIETQKLFNIKEDVILKINTLLKQTFDISDPNTIKKWLVQFKDEKMIKETINYSFQQHKLNKINNPLGYIFKVLESGGAVPDLKKIEKEKKEKERQKKEIEREKQKRIKEKYEIYCNEKRIEFEETLSEEEKTNILNKEINKQINKRPTFSKKMTKDFAKYDYRLSLQERAKKEGFILSFKEWKTTRLT